MKLHRYSGWPGAYCLDCFKPDPMEEAMAHGCDRMVCITCLKNWPMPYDPCLYETDVFNEQGEGNWIHAVVFNNCGEHGSEECYGADARTGEAVQGDAGSPLAQHDSPF